MSSANTSNEHKVQVVVADPSALGLFGLAMVTLVAASAKLGWTAGLSFLIPWAVLLGGVAQLVACVYDYQHNNLFGATAFGAYGIFWISLAVCWAIKLGAFGPALASQMDGRQLGVAFVGYLLFSLFITVASVDTNRVLLSIMVLIDILLAALAIDALGGGVHWAHVTAAWTELAISALGFYASAGAFLNRFAGRIVLPVGTPMGLLRRAA
jgi:uncharacterized protein